MAAQERARQAEQKEKEAKLASERAAQAKKDAALKKEEEERIQKAKSVLKSAAGNALEDKQERILRELEGKKPAASPITGQSKAPPENSFQPAPPPFEAINFQASEQRQQQQNTQQNHQLLHQQQNQPQPPSFDFVEQQLKPPPSPVPATPSAPSPSAPEIMHHEYDHFEGILPVAPPPTEQQPPSHDFLSDSLPAPPPSFTEFEQQQQQQVQEQFNPDMDDGIFAYDDEGNPLSPEQRQAMIDEQRRLYEEIVKEKAANDAAIAQANADAFDSRSSSAAVKAMESRNQIMDSVGRVGVNGETSADEDDEEGARERRSRRMVKIGNNQTVALHGQERTKKAIKEGTAILVQCINCQNWMQVTETATLMFCPVCQVVSPVIKQNEVMTKDEAIQLTMDRKLAEKLQAEAYASEEEEGGGKAEEGYFAKLFGMGGTEEASSKSSPATASKTVDDSWWGKISSIVSYGVAEEPKERGDLGVTRPPGSSSSSSYPGQRRGVNTMNHTSISSAGSSSPSRSEEYAGLLRPVTDGNEANLPAGRVAEQKPLFSCIYDSVSTAASAAFSTGAGEDDEGNVHGVDSSSLLVTNARRGDGGGNYSQLPDDD